MLNAQNVERYITDNGGSGEWLLIEDSTGTVSFASWSMGALPQPTTSQLDVINSTIVVEEAARNERDWRDKELAGSDFTMLSGAPLTIQQVSAWNVYRSECRNMPTLTGFPLTHTRPVKLI